MNDDKNIILVIATGWGPKHGGINAFNKGLCIGIADYIKEEKLELEIEVVCAVSSYDESDIADAQDHNVVLRSFEPKKKNEFLNANDIFEIEEDLKSYNSGHNRVKYVILHDLSTGDLFNKQNNAFPNAKDNWSAIHHMHYREYEHIKGYEANKSKLEKTISQYNLFNGVKYVFAVGPYLKELLEKFFQEKRNNTKIVKLIPGLSIQDEFINTDPEIKINGLTFGRLDVRHDNIKLASLAMDAWIKAINYHKRIDDERKTKKLQKSKLNIVGFDFDNEADKARCEELQKKHGDLIAAFPYTRNEPILNYMLADSTIAFMLSRHEGFGLTGWEAIAAGIPLITTTNSGLYKFLEKFEKGQYKKYVHTVYLANEYTPGKYTTEEAEDVYRKLSDYIKNYKDWHEKADKLKEVLRTKFTWKNTARTLLDAIGVSSQTDSNGLIPKRDGDAKQHRPPKSPVGISDFAIHSKFPMKISDFATHCVENAHALIISHRTKIIQPLNEDKPYSGMLAFLNSFTDPEYEVNTSNGIKKSLLIFVVDIGGNNIDRLNAKVLSNYLTLQSFLKAIFLLSQDGNSHHISSSNPSDIIRAYNGNAKNLTSMNEEYWLAQRCLMDELMNRVVIIVKNFDNYVQRISDIEKKLEINPPMIKNGSIFDEHNIYKGPDFGTEFKNLLPNHILREKIPPLDYLRSQTKCNTKWIEDNSTNFVGSDAGAFGLFSTVKFKDFKNSTGKEVECFAFNKDKDECFKMPLDDSMSQNGTSTLYKDGIEDSMAVTCMAATHYLLNQYWIKKENALGRIWPDYQDCKQEKLEWAYYRLQKVYNFKFFTIPQYLAQPVLFPDEVFS